MDPSFAAVMAQLNLSTSQLLSLLRNPQFASALTSNPDGTPANMSFSAASVSAFQVVMQQVAAAGWQIDPIQYPSANWSALASSAPGESYQPATDPLGDQLDAL
jgi:hypothetical protein